MISVLEREVVVDRAPADRKRFLFAHWEGGGNTPPMLALVRRLVGRGHEVRVIGDPCNLKEVEAAGGKVIAVALEPGYSTTGMVEQILTRQT